MSCILHFSFFFRSFFISRSRTSFLPHRSLCPFAYVPLLSQKSSFVSSPSFSCKSFPCCSFSFSISPYILARVPLISGVSHCLKEPSVPRLFHPPLSSLCCTRTHKETLLSTLSSPFLQLPSSSLLPFSRLLLRILVAPFSFLETLPDSFAIDNCHVTDKQRVRKREREKDNIENKQLRFLQM